MRPRNKRTAKRALAALYSNRWAMRPDSLRQMIQIAARRNGTPEAIEAQLGRPLDNTEGVTVRDGIARIPVSGPLFRYASVFTRCSGATAYEDLALDFSAALHDSQIRAIVLDIDSPGGEVNGCAEMAELIYNARGKKPIVAHISGDGCSGAYWLATAADSIVAGDTAVVGCIGVVACFTDYSKALEMIGIEEIEIVSSQTPNKRPDPAEDAGRSQIQRTIDDLAAVFIESLAKYRGVAPDVVQSEYGQGDVFVGAAAVAAGLIDGVATYEELHASLLESSTSGSPLQFAASTSTRETTMKTQGPKGAKGATASKPNPAANEDEDEEKKPVEDEKDEARAATEEDEEKKPAEDDEEKEAGASEDDEDKDDESDEEKKDETAKTAAKRERARILGIQALAKPGQEKIATEAINAGLSVNAAARRFLEAERGVGAQRLKSLKSDESHLDAPGPIAPAAVSNGDASDRERGRRTAERAQSLKTTPSRS